MATTIMPIITITLCKTILKSFKESQKTGSSCLDVVQCAYKQSQNQGQNRRLGERRTISEKNNGDAWANLQLCRLNCKSCRFDEN